jgi:hypothetical protein
VVVLPMNVSPCIHPNTNAGKFGHEAGAPRVGLTLGLTTGDENETRPKFATRQGAPTRQFGSAKQGDEVTLGGLSRS